MRRVTFKTSWAEVREYTVDAPDGTTEEEVFFHLSRFTDAESADYDSLSWSEELERGSFDVLSEDPDPPTVEATVILKVAMLESIAGGGDEAAATEALQGIFAAHWDELQDMTVSVTLPAKEKP